MAIASNGTPKIHLEEVDYDAVEHLDDLCQSLDSLKSLKAVDLYLVETELALSIELLELEVAREESRKQTLEKLDAIESQIKSLSTDTEAVRAKAQHAEEELSDLTAGIKRLDGAKRNITSSITALKRLQMLSTAYDQLKIASSNKQYRETAPLLEAVLQLIGHFKSYRSILQIAMLSKSVADFQRSILEEIFVDFTKSFSTSRGMLSLLPGRADVLRDVGSVLDVLGDAAVSRVTYWYCVSQLKEYKNIFKVNEEAGSLENLGRRYVWFKRLIQLHDSENGSVFPQHWQIGRKLSTMMCEYTREDVRSLLNGLRGQLEVALLLQSLQETLEFEQWLEWRASGQERMSIDTNNSGSVGPSEFGKSISEVFEPYLGIYVESQAQVIQTRIQSYKSEIKDAAWQRDDSEASKVDVLPSSADLFLLYRQTLSQIAKLSTGAPLVDLSSVFGRCLQIYADQILNEILREKHSDTVFSACLVLNTSDYCFATVAQLEDRLKRRLADSDLREQITFEKERNIFLTVANSALRTLGQMVQREWEYGFRVMSNTNWATIEEVQDRSTYVPDLESALQNGAALILPKLEKEKYKRIFCDKLVEAFAIDFVQTLVKSRPISEAGAEQILLDLYSIKNCLINLPKQHSETALSTFQSYVRYVNTGILRLETILKVILTSRSPIEGLVNNYFFLVGDKDIDNFTKILELKGIRTRADQAPYIDLFNSTAPKHENLVDSSSFLASLHLLPTSQSLHSSNTSLSGRFDPSQLGTAIFTAATAGGDRLPRTPELIQGSTKFNENIKNFGRMFRRDMSSRFRTASRDVTTSPK